MIMTSPALIKTVAKDVGMTQKDVKAVLDATEMAVKTMVQNGDGVKVIDINIAVKDVPAHTGFNPLTKEHVDYPATKKVSVRPAVDLKRAAKG